MHIRHLFLLTALTLTASAQTRATPRPGSTASQNSAIHNVFYQPNELHQGSPIFVTVELEHPATRVTGSFVNKPLTFFSDSTDKKIWHALAGVDLEATPGDYGLDVTATLAGGRLAHSTQQITICCGRLQDRRHHRRGGLRQPNRRRAKADRAGRSAQETRLRAPNLASALVG